MTTNKTKPRKVRGFSPQTDSLVRAMGKNPDPALVVEAVLEHSRALELELLDLNRSVATASVKQN